MRHRFIGLTVAALVTVACGQGAMPSPSAPSALAQPANIVGNLAVSGTLAAHETGTFAYHAGDAFIAGAGLPANPQATADNGDVVTVHGTGMYGVSAR